MQATFAALGAAAVGLAALAHVADRRRLARHDPDKVGFMPWPALSMIGTAGAMFLFALALLAG
jgi:hypothetical protein